MTGTVTRFGAGGERMIVTVVSHKGYQLRAGAFEVPTLGGYISSVLIVQDGCAVSSGKLFTTRSPSASGLFDSEQEAIAAALSFGEKVVGRAPLTP